MTQNQKSSSAGLFPSSLSGEGAAGWITAFCDGGSRGNPGPSGYGVFIQTEDARTVAELSEFLGKKTNNYAEYSGLLAALDFAMEHGHARLRVVSDSELMVKQIKGQYRVNSPDLKPLYEEAKRRIAQLDHFRIEHVLRGKNQQADRLANEAMDRGAQSSTAAAKPASGFRAAVRAVSGEATSISKPPTPSTKALRGLVKGGVIHLVEGDLPEGIFVTVTPVSR